MADAVWPVSLPPEPRLKEYQETPPDLTLRTAVSAGPDKVRRRNSANVRVAEFTFDFTQEQWETFDEFFLETIAGGALPFELTRPSTGNVADFRIVGLPRYTPLSPRSLGRWVVRFQAEMLPGTEQVDGDPDPPDPEDPWSLMMVGGYVGDSAIADDAVEWEDPYAVDVMTLLGAAPPAQEDFIMLLPQDFGLELEPAGSGNADDSYTAAMIGDGDSTGGPVYGGVEDGGYGGVGGGAIN